MKTPTKAKTSKASDVEEKSDIPHNPLLDNALTAFLLIACVYQLKVLIEESHLPEFVVHAVAIIVGRKLCFIGFRQVALRIGTAKNLEKPRNIRKFCEQSWSLVTHLAFSAIEIKILSEVEWWQKPSTAFIGGPRPGGLLRTLYLFQMATYTIGAFSHRFFEARHKDYFVMYTHHIVTLWLLAGSHHLNAEQFGMTVLTAHDVTDVPADLVKMANYMGLDASTGLYLTELCFAAVLATWGYARLYVFPFRLIVSGFYDTGPVCEGVGRTAFDEPFFGCWVLRVFLLMLACMHYYWYYLFLRILYRLVKGTDAHSAGREDYEGDSDADSDSEKKKK